MANISINLRIYIYIAIILFVLFGINKSGANINSLIISLIVTVVAVLGYFGLIREHS
jgi:hypothetical protein